MALIQDPLPVAPRHGQEVAGVKLELRWAPTDHPERYRVQIAADADFEEVVFEEVVPGTTVALTVYRQFAEPGRMFYWRVFAGSSGNWSPGDHGESFVSGAVDPAEIGTLPDEEEPLGPTAGLFRTAGLQAWAEVTPDGPKSERTGEASNPIEGAEIVTLGMTLILTAGIVIAAILILIFFAC